MSSHRFFSAGTLLLASTLAAWGAAPTRPNIVFIITDDQGYGDISAHGNPILKTPNLDRLRSESVRFVDFHVSPTCAPTRSALATGRHEFKNGVTHTIFERERLTLSATTLAQVLKGAGYTTGIFGKWHLGDEPEYQPERRGYDESFIHGGGGIGQIYPGSCGDAPGNTYFDPAIRHNGTFEKTRGYCTDVFFAQAVRTPRWHLVSINGGREPAWELFDLAADPGEITNLAARHSDVVARLAASYDDWWKAARAGMVNEKAVGPRLNPFKEAYWKQFGGGPSADELRIMEPTQSTVPGRKGG